MKKLLIVLFVLGGTMNGFTQAPFTSTGFLKQEPLSRNFVKMLKELDGNYLVAEQQSIKGISLGGRVLSIRSINKKTLQVNKTKYFKSISMQMRKDEFRFMNIWQNGNSINVLAQDNSTKDVVVLKIDATTLALSPKKKTLFSISESYKKAPSDLKKLFDKKQLYFETEVASSPDQTLTYVLVYLNEKQKPTKLLGYLIDENGEVKAETNLQFKTDVQLEQENTTVNLLDDGRVVLLANIQDLKGYIYEDLQAGPNLCFLGANGKLESLKRLKVNGQKADGKPVEKFAIDFLCKGSKLFIAGYETTSYGLVSGVFDMDKASEDYTLEFQAHNKQLLAEYWASNEKQLAKNLEKVDKGKIDIISNYVHPTSLTVAENGDLIILGSQDYIEVKRDSETGRTTTTYYFKTILVQRITQQNELVFSKVLRFNQSTKSNNNIPLMEHKAFEIRGKIILFLNDYYSAARGFQLEGEEIKGLQGAMIIIDGDGSGWKKEPYHLDKTVDGCLVISEGGMLEDDKTLLLPVKLWSKVSIGYARFMFK